MVQNQLQAQEYQKSILDLEQQRFAKLNELRLRLQTTFEQLSSQFRIYEQKYVIKSPIDGKVSFFKFWNVNQFVQAGDPVMTIVPASNDIIGKALIPASGSGKLAAKQVVKIKLDNYNYREFGIINGIVKSVSAVPQENMYSVDIELPNGLNTSYKKKIPISSEMAGAAEIVTEDLRLLDRIFYQFKSLKDNQ
jgi:multidrug resistance efflux pump